MDACSILFWLWFLAIAAGAAWKKLAPLLMEQPTVKPKLNVTLSERMFDACTVDFEDHLVRIRRAKELEESIALQDPVYFANFALRVKGVLATRFLHVMQKHYQQSALTHPPIDPLRPTRQAQAQIEEGMEHDEPRFTQALELYRDVYQQVFPVLTGRNYQQYGELLQHGEKMMPLMRLGGAATALSVSALVVRGLQIGHRNKAERRRAELQLKNAFDAMHESFLRMVDAMIQTGNGYLKRYDEVLSPCGPPEDVLPALPAPSQCPALTVIPVDSCNARRVPLALPAPHARKGRRS